MSDSAAPGSVLSNSDVLSLKYTATATVTPFSTRYTASMTMHLAAVT
jgi:hypothetical protein